MDGELRIGDQDGHQSVVRRTLRLAERQFGAVARWQLLERHVSPAQIRSWVRSGRLHSRYPGVYAVGRPGLSTEGEMAAALLYAGPGATLGGLSALWWMELLGRRPSRIHVEAPGRRSSREGIAIRHPAEIQRDWHRGIPHARLPQALLAASEALTQNSLRLVLARADFKQMLDLPSLHGALAHHPRGARAVRAALASHLPQIARCASPLEVDFVLLCERHGIEIPEPNARIGRHRPDMLWRGARLIVELDGTAAHSSAAQTAADELRQAALEERGYVVLRFTSADVRLAPGRVAAEVRSAMIAACASPSPPTR